MVKYWLDPFPICSWGWICNPLNFAEAILWGGTKMEAIPGTRSKEGSTSHGGGIQDSSAEPTSMHFPRTRGLALGIKTITGCLVLRIDRSSQLTSPHPILTRGFVVTSLLGSFYIELPQNLLL